MSADVANDFILQDKDDLMHLYVPTLSFTGKSELEERTRGFEPNIYTFMEHVDGGSSIMEIAMENFWTLKETSTYFLITVDNDFIKAPVPVKVVAMAGFMAGRYRTGEYFRRIGKIDVDQLELIIRRHKELNDQGQKIKIGDVMIELGYLTKKDTDSLMKIKDEADKRFILDPSIIPTGASPENNQILSELDQLKKQNIILKAKLAKLLAMFKKNNVS